MLSIRKRAAASKQLLKRPNHNKQQTDGEGDDVAEVKKQLRLGLVECVNHGLLQPYPVLHEKAGELVAQIKGTVLLMPNGNDRVTSAPEQPVETDKKVEDEELCKLLATGLKVNKKKKKPAA